jgi:cell division protein FtsA
MLPAGAVLVGGGAKLPGAVDVAKKILRLPAQTGFPADLGGIVDKVDEPGFVTAVGLALWGLEDMPVRSTSMKMPGLNNMPNMGKTVEKMKGWFRKFLP